MLTLSCPDRPGIVHAVAAFLHGSGGNILDSQQFADLTMNRFFMRVHIETLGAAPADLPALRAGFAPIAGEFGMDWDLHDLAVRPRVLIMVSREGHCLNDLLYRREAESLAIDVPLVVGNHPDLARLAAGHGVPFEHVPVGPDPADRAEAEGRLLDLVGRAPHRLRGAGPVHADPVPGGLREAGRAGSSTSTTRSCPASAAPGPTSRRTSTA